MTLSSHHVLTALLLAAALAGCSERQQDAPGVALASSPAPPLYGYHAVSPDGQQIAFMSSQGQVNGNPKLYLKDATGTVLPLTDGPQIDSYPIWSPDGQRLAFISTRDGFYEVYRLDLDTRDTCRLTYNTGGKIRPASLTWGQTGQIGYDIWQAGRWATTTTPADVDFDALDFDNDGLPNGQDNDLDGDGVANDVDNAPLLANPHQLDQDGDGAPDVFDRTLYLMGATFDPLTQALDLPPELIDPQEGEYWLIQLDDYELFYTLEEAGVAFLEIVPDRGYVVHTTMTRQELEAYGDMRWVGVYQPGYKMRADMRSLVSDHDLFVRIAPLLWGDTSIPGGGPAPTPEHDKTLEALIKRLADDGDYLEGGWFRCSRLPDVARVGEVWFVESGVSSRGPAIVLTHFFAAVERGDVNQAWAMGSRSAQEAYEDLEAFEAMIVRPFAGGPPDPLGYCMMTGEEIDGDSANVRFVSILEIVYPPGGGVYYWPMVKEEGQWKLATFNPFESSRETR